MSKTRRIGLIAAGTAVAVLAFLLLRPTPAPEPAPTPEQASDTGEQRSTTTAPRPTPKPRYQSIAVPSGGADGDVAEVEVRKGETVRLSFRSEGPGEIHIHGYDPLREAEGWAHRARGLPSQHRRRVRGREPRHGRRGGRAEGGAVRRGLAVPVAVIVAAGALAPSAEAHGISQRSDLPIPEWLFAWAAAVVLVISFVALVSLWPDPRLEGEDWRRLPRPVGRVLTSPALAVACGAVGVVLLGLVIYSGLVGQQTASANFAPNFVYVAFWVGLVPISVLFGDVFRVFNPWYAIGRAVAWVSGRVAGQSPSRPAHLPRAPRPLARRGGHRAVRLARARLHRRGRAANGGARELRLLGGDLRRHVPLRSRGLDQSRRGLLGVLQPLRSGLAVGAPRPRGGTPPAPRGPCQARLPARHRGPPGRDDRNGDLRRRLRGAARPVPGAGAGQGNRGPGPRSGHGRRDRLHGGRPRVGSARLRALPVGRGGRTHGGRATLGRASGRRARAHARAHSPGLRGGALPHPARVPGLRSARHRGGHLRHRRARHRLHGARGQHRLVPAGGDGARRPSRGAHPRPRPRAGALSRRSGGRALSVLDARGDDRLHEPCPLWLLSQVNG
jgi:hypothetical protein